jgi:heterodisulfide reductase subunit C1
MGELYDKLMKDVRFIESLKACINCGTCTAICPAAEFYNYDPRTIATTVQTQEDSKIRELLKSETIWYCGECMSCKTRCPRGNAPGLLIIALRALSQDLGYFVESEKGRQQLALKRAIGDKILSHGYCINPESIVPELHPEQGPVWEWEMEHIHEVMDRLGANYQGEGAGALRKIPENDLEEIRRIFEVTGGLERFSKIEQFSKSKSEDMGIEFGDGLDNEYFRSVYSQNNQTHTRE